MTSNNIKFLIVLILGLQPKRPSMLCNSIVITSGVFSNVHLWWNSSCWILCIFPRQNHNDCPAGNRVKDLRSFYAGFPGGVSGDEEAIGLMMSVADSNKDGFVGYDEFEHVLGCRRSPRNKGHGVAGVMEDVCKVMDRDGDGKVGLEDLKSYMNWAGFSATEEEIKAMIKLGGGDEDSVIIQVKSREELRDEIHLAALDSVVNLNSLCAAFTFIGLSLTTMELQSIDGRFGCNPNISTIRNLMLFEVISFAFFLASSLVAYGLKIMMSLINAAELNEEFRNHFNRKSIRKVMLCAIFTSILG
ncbi:hypothetical protein CK203_064442 [Vitis vinifera]|uniref:EF-hand domain-containing protein n=1 Tax=Vitis vinifera TaxID=29760 RepID=A0A438GRB2_VITVI|nr:hypothetical protein CK203_064442 [Vitis vinifera]